MSEEIIKVLDALGDKMGIAIDWNAKNVMPYMEKICEKYVTYELATSIMWIVICVAVFVSTRRIVKAIKSVGKKIEEDPYSDWDIYRAAMICGLIIILTITITIFLFQVTDIIKCVTFPEKVIIDHITMILKRKG